MFEFDAPGLPAAERVALQRQSILHRIGLEADSVDARTALMYTGMCVCGSHAVWS
jgi:hypothetical protein